MRQQQEREEREGELAKRHINSSDCIERKKEREKGPWEFEQRKFMGLALSECSALIIK